jgi:branched-chain amino acid transport system ATP-binding protein
LAPFQRARLGIGRTFQRVALFSELSVQEHLLVALRGGETRRARLSVLVDVVRPSAVEARRIAETLALIGLADRADALVATLPLGACRLLEIGRALVSEPRVLLADEPSSGLDRREAATLAQVLGALPARGVGVLLIEHDLGLVRSVCDRVVVLDVGRLIAEGPFETAIATPQVRRAYLGQGVA